MNDLVSVTLTKSLLFSVVIAALNATIISRAAAEPCHDPTFVAVRNSYVAQIDAMVAKLKQTHSCALIPSILALAHRGNAKLDSIAINTHGVCSPASANWTDSTAVAVLQRDCRSGEVGIASNTSKSDRPKTHLPTTVKGSQVGNASNAAKSHIPKTQLAAISRPEKKKSQSPEGLSKGSYKPQDTAAFGEWNTGNPAQNNNSSYSPHWDWNTPRATGAPVHPWGRNDQNRVANMPAQYPEYLLPSGVGQSIYNQSSQSSYSSPSYWSTVTSEVIAALVPYMQDSPDWNAADAADMPPPVLQLNGVSVPYSPNDSELKSDPEFLGPQKWQWVGPPQDTLHGPTSDWKPGDPCDIELPECTPEFADTPSAEDWNKGPEGLIKGTTPPPIARGVMPEWFEAP